MKYKITRIPEEAYKNFVLKQEKMGKVYKAITGKQKTIPLTKVITMASKENIRMGDVDLMKEFKKKGRKRR